MAAAALSRSLFFIFTLLSLVFLTSSLVDKKELEKLKKDLKSAQQSIDRMMEGYLTTVGAAKDLLDDTLSLMKPLIALMKRIANQITDFPQVDSYMEKVYDFIEKNRAYIDGHSEEVTALFIEDFKKQLVKFEKFLEDLEKHHTEL